MKKIVALLLTLTLIITAAGCIGGEIVSAHADTTDNANQDSIVVHESVTVTYDSDDEDTGLNGSEMSFIIFEENSITIDGPGAVIDGSQIAITSAGTYSLSGTLEEGQVIVLTKDEETVRLVLNGLDITCSTSAPVFIKQAKKVVITLAEGTENYVTDGETYDIDDSGVTEPNAAIFSKSDLTINGEGSLTVNANYNNGIQSKDDLKITGGAITVTAVNDGIKGKDSIAVKNANITVDTDGDGMQSDNDEDPERGYVVIESGTFDITAGADGIQAETSLLVSDGDITISSGGGSANSSSNIGSPGNTWGEWGNQGMPGPRDNFNVENETGSDSSTGSAKGLKAGENILITGGTINIDSSDDSIHSNDSLTIDSGNITMASGDDGMHSDATLEINGGDIDITKSYEGIESKAITVNGGTIHLVSNDDGFNASGGNDGSAMNGRPGQNQFRESGDSSLNVNGGYIAVDAGGDGLDINGTIHMTDGVIIINGPTNDGNGAIDYLGTFKVTGGFIVAAGSSGMAQAPDTSSTQYSVLLNFTSSYPGDTMIHIETESGDEVLTFVPAKTYQSVALCSSELQNGTTYSVYSGGSSTGKVTDGLYSGGTYTHGTQVESFTVSGIVTTVGTPARGGFPGGGGPPAGGGMR